MALKKDGILALLDKLQITHTTIEHAASPTCEAHSAALQGTSLSQFIGKCQAKNLFFKVPSGGGKLKNRLFLICALVDTVVEPKSLSARLGIKASAPLRFADATLFDQVLQVPQGSVTPFVMANESTKEVVLLLDAKFAKCEQLLFHPMRNDWTSAVTPAGLNAFLAGCGANSRTVYVDMGSSEDIPLPEDGAAAAAEKATEQKPKAKAKAEAKAPEPEHEAPKEKKEQDFAPDHMFRVHSSWEDTIFATAHQQWLARRTGA